MTQDLLKEQRAELANLLNQRRSELREVILAELTASENEYYLRIAGEVNDRGERSVADLLVDVDHAVVNLHMAALRDIEAAQRRIENDSYGVCSDCGTRINFARLKAYPSALRCRDCQERVERRFEAQSTPRL